jgi:predicted DNA-binding WGR domain protein
MRRFYRLDVQPDLFGGVLLVKEWGRIGAHARRRTRGVEDASICPRNSRSRVEAMAGGRYPRVAVNHRRLTARG